MKFKKLATKEWCWMVVTELWTELCVNFSAWSVDKQFSQIKQQFFWLNQRARSLPRVMPLELSEFGFPPLVSASCKAQSWFCREIIWSTERRGKKKKSMSHFLLLIYAFAQHQCLQLTFRSSNVVQKYTYWELRLKGFLQLPVSDLLVQPSSCPALSAALQETSLEIKHLHSVSVAPTRRIALKWRQIQTFLSTAR